MIGFGNLHDLKQIQFLDTTGSIIQVGSGRPLGYEWFSRQALLKRKDFRLDGRLDTSGEGGEPKRAIPTWLLVHSPTSVLMVARGLREASTGGDGKGREEK